MTTTTTRPSKPVNGWVEELHEAKEAYRKASSNGALEQEAEAFLRWIRALNKLRRFSDVEKLLSYDSRKKKYKRVFGNMTSRQKQECDIYKAKAEQELAVQTELNAPGFQNLLKSIRQGEMNPDQVLCPSGNFKNTTLFHKACINGDIRAMEKIVAAGAAIDLPFLEVNDFSSDVWQPWEMAPTKNSALAHLCVDILGGFSVRSGAHRQEMKEQTEKQVECAVQLVNLGADCTAKILLRPTPTGGGRPDMALLAFWRLGVDGKTIYEIGCRTGKKRLIDAMNRMKTNEDRIRLAHCRCGSHLPWLECHSGHRDDASTPHYTYRTHANEQILCFRYSPLANCPCNRNTKTNKTHFHCCWFETSCPSYQVDSTGLMVTILSTPVGFGDRFDDAMSTYVNATQQSGASPDSPLFPSLSNMTQLEAMADTIRRNPELFLHALKGVSDRPSAIASWDLDVYAGTMERIPNFFQWKDLHWDIAREELLARAREWNTALEKYCDDKGLARGSPEREEVVRRHSTLAPCANPQCDVMETSVKQFNRCSRCRKVAYCSRACQKDHWKKHKARCGHGSICI